MNIETLRLKLRTEKAGATLGLAFDRKEGNSDSLRAFANGQALYRAHEVEYLATAERELGESAGVRSSNRSLGHFRATYPFASVIAGEVYSQLEQNQFTRLSFRGLAGAGARTRLVNEETFLMFGGVGAFWSRENYDAVAGAADLASEDVARGNFYLTLFYEFDRGVSITSVTYFQPAFGSLADHRVLQTTDVDLPVSERFSVALAYSLALDSRPPESVKQTDQTYATVLKWAF